MRLITGIWMIQHSILFRHWDERENLHLIFEKNDN